MNKRKIILLTISLLIVSGFWMVCDQLRNYLTVENRCGQLDVRPFVKPIPGRTIALVWRPSSPFAHAFEELARTLSPR